MAQPDISQVSKKPTTFSDLPTELRLLIWGYAARIPEDEHIIIRVLSTPIMPSSKAVPWNGPYRQYKAISGIRPLGTLGANHKSREVTLIENPHFIQFRGPSIYFNAHRNTIHLDRHAV